jgi:hypothetical protein
MVIRITKQVQWNETFNIPCCFCYEQSNVACQDLQLKVICPSKSICEWLIFFLTICNLIFILGMWD